MTEGEFPRAEFLLNDILRMRESIRHAQCEVADLEAMIDLSGYDPAKTRVKGSRGRDRLAESLHRLSVRRDELAGLIDDYTGSLRRADAVISRLPDPRHARFLNLRYLEGMTYAEIGKAMCYSDDHVRKEISKAALASLEAVLSRG